MARTYALIASSDDLEQHGRRDCNEKFHQCRKPGKHDYPGVVREPNREHSSLRPSVAACAICHQACTGLTGHFRKNWFVPSLNAPAIYERTAFYDCIVEVG